MENNKNIHPSSGNCCLTPTRRPNQPNLHVFGAWGESAGARENPRRAGDNMQTCILSTCLSAGRVLCRRCGGLLHVSTSVTEEQPNRGNHLRRTSLKPTMPFSRSAIIPTHASARASSQIKSSSSTPTRPWSPSQSNPPAAPAHHSSFSPHAEAPPPLRL